jgi:hypothetical protein
VQSAFIDVNGDRFLSAIDALLVINHLNRVAAGEGEAIAAALIGHASDASQAAAEPSQAPPASIETELIKLPAVVPTLASPVSTDLVLAVDDDSSDVELEAILAEISSEVSDLRLNA